MVGPSAWSVRNSTRYGCSPLTKSSSNPSALFHAAQILLRGRTPHGRSILHLHDQNCIILEGATALPLQTDGEPIGFAHRVEIHDLPKALEIYY